MRLSACRPTEPSVTTTCGPIRVRVSFKNEEQFLISLVLGLRLFPFSKGVHNAALVINTSARVRPICFKSVSKLSPDLSPCNGIPVRPAPKRPGASATKTIFAFRLPLAELNIAGWSARAGHRRHPAACFAKSLKFFTRLFRGYLCHRQILLLHLLLHQQHGRRRESR